MIIVDGLKKNMQTKHPQVCFMENMFAIKKKKALPSQN